MSVNSLNKYHLYHALLFLVLLPSSCRKDLLHFQKVQKIDSHTSTDRLNRIIFINDSLGYVVGGLRFYSSVILTTNDGGNTFSLQSFPEAGKCLYGITYSPSGSIYTCGFDGKLLTTHNYKDWKYYQEMYMAFSDIAFSDANYGIIVGGISFNEGFRYYVDSSGNMIKWDSLSFQLNRIVMANEHVGYIGGYGVLQKTTDGGKTWAYEAIDNDNYTGIDVITENDVWVCGYGGSILHTTDGGTHWERLRNGNDITIPTYHLYDIVFKDGMNGWAVGDNGKVIRTDDGGHHWMEYDHFTDEALRSIAICPNGDLLVAGDNGSLYRLITQ